MGYGFFAWRTKMSNDEKTAVIVDFYKTAELAQKSIEAGLDEWLKGTGTAIFDKILLNVAELAIQLLRIGCDKKSNP